jgi:hypothetical protein
MEKRTFRCRIHTCHCQNGEVTWFLLACTSSGLIGLICLNECLEFAIQYQSISYVCTTGEPEVPNPMGNASIIRCVDPDSPPQQMHLSVAKSIQQSSHTKQSQRSWLAGSVDNFVIICKAIETRGRTLGISTHVLEGEPIANVQ